MARIVIGEGEVFGKLHVLEQIKIRGVGVRYRCQCECGNEILAIASNLKKGNTTTCGCWRKTHGLTKSKIYGVWKSMLRRCEKPNETGFKNYGGRGIKVCERWHIFENFFADMGHAPEEGYTLDRINNDGNYCKENCKWSDWTEQHGNKRNSRYLTAFGKSQSLHAWAREYGCNARTLHNRVYRGRVPLEIALAAPVHKGRKL